MDAKQEARLRQLAKVSAFDTTLLSLRLQNAALIAVMGNVKREDFLDCAAISFDGVKEIQDNETADRFAKLKAQLCEGEPSKESP